MDFGTLLDVAQKNGGVKQPVAYYRTKFTPPKKETKQTKNLSDNIKKFLARREEEERQKALDEKKKKENLLALRDQKTQNRINKHLKVCKAANKSVLADAVDNENTAVTMAGPSQPDEDDYGYVSQEASAFYNQLMNKYNNLPPEKPIFSDTGKRTVKDIASTKDRVKRALQQKESEDTAGHRRKRKSSSAAFTKEVERAESGKREPDSESAKADKPNAEKGRDRGETEEEKPKPRKRAPLPPPMDFVELLKLAEKKQHEPIVLEAKPKPKPKVEAPERLMTKKQKREYQREKESRERKREERGAGPEASRPPPKPNDGSGLSSTAQGKRVVGKSLGPSEKPPANGRPRPRPAKTSEKDLLMEERRKLESEKRKLEEMRRRIEEEKRKLELSKCPKPGPEKPRPAPPVAKPPVAGDKARRETDPVKARSTSTSTSTSSAPRPDLKPREPPANSRPALSKQHASLPSKRPGRIEDDEDEYDSELDDFIDDGPEEAAEDYSKYISEIFGYDKNKYRNSDDYNDDAAMESNFAQQLKEEYVSTKIGIMEDLEDIRMEAMEKKRKSILKKKLKKS
ncbi:protein SPT2 homolog isoform X2 [Orussus abietinus]|uniref:protein SPT2 homolog isoform X2 n=1 Tax=Orussus abietinus TaxID=222816 RepID=UPI00062530E2|nr:protein SPT2 homolog isoform X2 [Orussus abietinus]